MSQPNLDPAHTGQMSGRMKQALRNFLMGVDDMLPARVVAYNDQTNRADVQPLVMMGTTDGLKVPRQPVRGIPTLRLGGGGFFLRFPLRPGDFGWIKANDRDISLILQSQGGEDWPNTERLHSFSDAVFIPDTVRDWAIDEADSAAVVLQSTDGTTKISIADGTVTIAAPTVAIQAEALTIDADVTITGAVDSTGGLVLSGDVEITGALTNNGVNVGSTHTHGGVEPGSGQSGPPTP